MQMPFDCHALGVPLIKYRNAFEGRSKTTWNLETWHPDGDICSTTHPATANYEACLVDT